MNLELELARVAMSQLILLKDTGVVLPDMNGLVGSHFCWSFMGVFGDENLVDVGC